MKHLRPVVVVLLVLAGCLAGPCCAAAPIKVFLNCTGDNCYRDYLTTELSFFYFVRDRAQADVEIFLIEQTTASEGTKFTLEFTGFGAYEDLKLSQTAAFRMTDTEAEIRAELLRIIKLNLAAFVLRSPLKNSVLVEFASAGQAAAADSAAAEDAWRNWVFLIGTDGAFEGESNRTTIESESYLSAYRQTLASKVILDAWYERTFNRFFVDNRNLRASVHNYGLGGYYAKSLNEHWSAGGFAAAEHDNFRNIELELRAAPAVEYNLFRFRENTVRQLRLGYQVGLRHFTYQDTTVFNRLRETRPFQRVALVAAFTRPWGSLSGVLQFTAFLDRLRQHRATGRLNTSVRLAEGLNLTLEGSTSLVNDQISLLRRTLPEEVYLLNGAQLPTRFVFDFRVGLRFTFGSTNNSIVNPRFENLDD